MNSVKNKHAKHLHTVARIGYPPIPLRRESVSTNVDLTGAGLSVQCWLVQCWHRRRAGLPSARIDVHGEPLRRGDYRG